MDTDDPVVVRVSESIESPVSLVPGRRTLSRWRHPSSKATEVLVGKVLVLYHSASGNTAAMARLVAEGAELIPGTEVRLREVGAAAPGDVHWCDGLAVGSPTN